MNPSSPLHLTSSLITKAVVIRRLGYQLEIFFDRKFSNKVRHQSKSSLCCSQLPPAGSEVVLTEFSDIKARESGRTITTKFINNT
jgi:hypothetical protein